MKRLSYIYAFCLLAGTIIPFSALSQFYYNWGIRNDCKEFFYNETPPDTNHDKFKKVTWTMYYGEDSAMQNKRMTKEFTATFNEKGQKLFSVEKDSSHVTDSTRFKYDKAFHMTYSAEWEAADSVNMYKVKEAMWVYDARENVLKDSSFEVRNTYWEESTDKVTVKYNTYDDSDNVLKTIEISKDGNGSDTDIVVNRYDKKNNLVFSRDKDRARVVRNYCSYNDKSSVIFKARVSGDDSDYTFYKYDDKQQVIEENEYDNRKLVKAYTETFDKYKRSIETEEILSTTDVMSCPNNKVTVTVSDSNGTKLSEVVTTEKNGSPFTTTTIYKITKGHNGRIDSTFITDDGYMYSELTLKIETRKFDDNGNEIGLVREDGAEYGINTRSISEYNAQNSVTYYAYYSSCTADAPENRYCYVYYPDGKSVKQHSDSSGTYMEYEFYLNDARVEKRLNYSIDSRNQRNYFLTIYEYQQ